MDGLVEALQSLGVSEGVRLLTASQSREDKQSSGMFHTDRETGSPLRLTHNLWSVNCEYNTLFLLPDSKEDSGFGSQSIGEEMGNPAVGNH